MLVLEKVGMLHGAPIPYDGQPTERFTIDQTRYEAIYPRGGG
jgi:hypothetical protein